MKITKSSLKMITNIEYILKYNGDKYKVALAVDNM